MNVIEDCWRAWRILASTVPKITVPCPDDSILTDATVEDYPKRFEWHVVLYQEKLKLDQDIDHDTAWELMAAMSCRWEANSDKLG